MPHALTLVALCGALALPPAEEPPKPAGAAGIAGRDQETVGAGGACADMA